MSGVSSPKRIQRRRTKGWRMPEGAVYVGRPGKFGNPFVVHAAEIVVNLETGEAWWCQDDARRESVDMFRDALHGGELPRISRADVERELAGRDLACWCPLSVPCHADVLLEIANSEVTA